MRSAETIDRPLLGPSEGPPVEVLNPAGAGDAIVVCEHAARRLPLALGTLGLAPAALDSHIAWDPGALALARRLSRALDAPLVAGRFSRLAYDCNRPPEATDAVPAASEIYDVPGNRGLGPAARWARVEALYLPFCRALAGCIDAKGADGGRLPALITVHSFTPVWFGRPRAVEIGVVHDTDRRLADALLARLATLHEVEVARNAPYGPADGVTHTLRAHALPHGLPNVMLEVRSDRIADEAGVAETAALIVPALADALADLGAAVR